MVRGSALKALKAMRSGKSRSDELMEAVDKNIPLPVRDVDKPFAMPIEDIFSISGRGTVVTGKNRTRQGEGGRGSGNRGLPSDEEESGDRHRNVPQAAG